MESDYQNGGTQSVARAVPFRKYGHHQRQVTKAFPPHTSSTISEYVHRLRENPSSAPKRSRFDSCGVRPVSTGLKYPRFLAYWPLATVINERGYHSGYTALARGCAHRLVDPHWLRILFIIFNSIAVVQVYKGAGYKPLALYIAAYHATCTKSILSKRDA